MDNRSFQSPLSAGCTYTDRPYDPLKEEMEVGVIGPQGMAVTSTVVNVGSYQVPPRDHIIWSVFNTLYMNFCCLGFMALVFSVKARDRKLAGDMNGAQSYGSTAKGLNITALVLTLLFYILIIILLASGIIAVGTLIHGMQEEKKLNAFNIGSG